MKIHEGAVNISINKHKCTDQILFVLGHCKLSIGLLQEQGLFCWRCDVFQVVHSHQDQKNQSCQRMEWMLRYAALYINKNKALL